MVRIGPNVVVVVLNGFPKLLVSGVTQEDGSFAVEWKARKTDAFDNTAEIQAKFKGDEDHRTSVSKQYFVTIETKKLTSILPSA